VGLLRCSSPKLSGWSKSRARISSENCKKYSRRTLDVALRLRRYWDRRGQMQTVVCYCARLHERDRERARDVSRDAQTRYQGGAAAVNLHGLVCGGKMNCVSESCRIENVKKHYYGFSFQTWSSHKRWPVMLRVNKTCMVRCHCVIARSEVVPMMQWFI
jgi:hypothetical protein